MRGIISIAFLCVSISFQLLAQGNLDVYRGNESFKEGDYDDAKKHYSAAIEKAPDSYKGVYNMGNAAYRQESFEEALTNYETAIANSNNDLQKSEAYHNLGNTYLQSGKLKESVDAFKQALRLNPSAQDTRYNLAYAQKMLKEQQKKEEENKDKNEDDKQDKDKEDKEKKDKEDEEDSEDQEKQDEQDKEKSDEEKEGDEGEKGDKDEEKENEKKENEPSEKGEDGKEEQKQPQPVNITPREAEQLLEAAKQEDQRIQMMMLNKEKKGESKKIEKNW